MPKYRKKPVVVDAWQFLTEDLANMPEWINSDGLAGESLYIDTLEGVMEAQHGDWIIRGVKGEVYPCKPDIFAETYDPAVPCLCNGEGVVNAIEPNQPPVPCPRCREKP